MERFKEDDLMSLDIDNFKGAVSAGGGIARSNIWMVQLPTNIPRAPNLNSNTMNLICKNVTMPGRQIVTSDRMIGMKPFKTAYGYLHDDVSMTFQVLNDNKIRDYFYAWSELVVNTETKELNYFNEYTRDVKIFTIKKRSTTATKIANALVIADVIVELLGGDLLTNSQVSALMTNASSGVRLQNAFPTTLNGFELNNDADGLIELNVQLSFKDWRNI